MEMPEKFSSDKKIDLACSAIARSIVDAFDKKSRHYSWPMPVIGSVDKMAFLYYEFLACRVFFYLKELGKKGFSLKEIATLARYPSVLSRVLHFPLAKDFTGLSKSELESLVEAIFDLVSILQEDRFCLRTHKNLLKEKVDPRKFKKNWILLEDNEAGIETRLALGRIKGVLFNYTELLFSIFHNIGHEFHGPYGFGKKESLLVSHYHDLNPAVWPLAEHFQYSEIELFEAYPKNSCGIKIDLHNRLFSTVPVSKIASKVLIFADGKMVKTPGEINALEKAVEKNLAEMIGCISSLSKEDLVIKYGEAMFYMFKPFADKLGLDWKPPKEFYEKAKKGVFGADESDYISLTSSMPLKYRYVKNCFDPRVTRAELFKRIKI